MIFQRPFNAQVKDLRKQSLSKNKPASGGNFQDSLLKLVRTLPKVLKFLPGDQAKDARSAQSRRFNSSERQFKYFYLRQTS